PVSRTQSSASATGMDASMSATTASKPPSDVLLKAKNDLRAHEAEIARLKLQIKQRQTKALLLQKMQKAKQQQPPPETPVDMVSTPSTPDVAVDDGSDAEPAPAPPVAPPKAPAVANASDEPIATRARSTSKAKPAALQHIPTIDYAKQALGYISDEARERHLGKIAAHLDEALELKKMTLQLLTRNSPSSGSKAADAEQKSRAQASERLKARQHRLGAERAELQHRVHQLHIATMIAGAERRFLDYSCGAGYELQKAVSSSECARSSRELEAEIQALVKLKKSMTRSGYTVQPADKQADVDVDVSMVIDPRPTQTVAEPQASPIAELQELSVSGLEPAATESVAAEPVVAEPEAKLTAAKPAVAALRAKMAAMQEEQSTMSQRLTTLAEKRKQASSAAATTLTSKKAKTRDKPAKCHPDSLTTSLHLVLKTMKRALDDHTGPYVGWCMSMAESLDTCMLQPLTLIDRIGVPSMICPRLSSGTESPSMADEQLASSAIPAATLAVAQNLPSQGGYVPYESMLGSMDAATVTTDTKLAVAGPSSTNLDKLTTDQLLAAIQEAPSDGLAKTQSYYHELRNALSAYKKNLQGGSISNGDLARTLLPVWNSYKHTFPKKHILPKNPLYTELGLKNVHHSPSVDAFTRKEQSLVLWLVERDGKSLPILNRDILRFRPPANKRNNPSNRPTGRYFEAAVVSQDGDEDSEEGEVTLATQQLDRSDAAYQQALDHFWKGLPTFKQRPPTLNDLRSYIASRADKNMGKAVLTLQQALEKVPESEKLWDLYLELYTRQRVSEKDVVSAFSDATRFHPYSTCIWRRYVVWCGWHAMKQKKPSAENTWLERLRMVASMAIKCLASAQATARTERLSATIVELLVYFWQCLWTAYKADKRQANGSGQPALSLPAYMHACLAAESISVLSDKMANVDLSVASEEQQQGLKGDWDCSQWALFTLLLPHHFLYAAQAFAFAFIDADFVSQHVLDCMFAALHSRTDSESMYFIDLDKIRGDGSTELDPRMVTFVLKLYGALLVGLDKPDATDVPSYTDHLTECSRALFHASIGATLAQLRQPHVLESHLPKRDELFWRFYGTPVSAGEVRSLPGQMASQGVHKFLLITLAVCANEFPGSFEDAALATTALWQHALFIAKSVNMDTADLESATQPGDDEDGNHALVAWRIAKARSLYYRIVGYSGTAAPKTYRQLADMIADTGDVDTFCRQIRDNAGVWTNVVLVELLYFEICARGQSNKQAVQSALAWLRCGLEHLDPENVGSRAQLWALLLRLLLTQRPLKDVDIVEMHQDLVHPPLADEFQNVVPCFMLMNFVLQPILQANPDNQTLTAIMEYLSVAARSNSELAVR
ncbi:Zinc finger C3H1 domain-containing protein, partial [Coemansia sp. Cherry 401B]